MLRENLIRLGRVDFLASTNGPWCNDFMAVLRENLICLVSVDFLTFRCGPLRDDLMAPSGLPHPHRYA